MWTKIMMNIVNLKIKVTRKTLKLLQLRKLKQRGVGVNEVEEYASKEVVRGGGRSREWKEKRRQEVVNVLMKGKIKSAEVELKEARWQFARLLSYLRRRWGHYHAILAWHGSIMQEEVRWEWKEGRDKVWEKVNHLERKWVRERRAERRGGAEDALVGIRWRDTELRRRAEEEGRRLGVDQQPLVYGGLQPTEEEAAIMALPPKFATYGAINLKEVEVEVELMFAKMKWELKAREERRGVEEEEEGGGEWTEEWEEEQQREKQVYCSGTGTMAFENRRVTDIPQCRRSIPPAPLPPRQSAILGSLKARVLDISTEYKASNCDARGNIKESNITLEEARGLKSIQGKVQEQEWVVMGSDKSGRLTANSRPNYLERMEPHVAGDTIATLEEQHSMERLLNATTLQWGRLLLLGDKWNTSGRHWARIKNALRTKNCPAPPLYGLPKDHKQVPAGEEHLGPPLRPVVGATESPNGALSELLTEILTTVGDRADLQRFNLLSTEEAMEALTTLNTRVGDMSKPVLVSMDVVGMYPNFHREEVARVAAEEFMRSDLVIEVDGKELGLYLAIVYQSRRQELVALGLDQVVQKRKHPRAKTIQITTDEVLARGQGESKFWDQEREPTLQEKKLMLSLALEEAILVAMGHHTYSLADQTRLQGRGGPIGLKLSGAIAKVYMIWWCRRFTETLQGATVTLPSFQQHLLKVYVDDGLQVCEELPPGSRYVDGQVMVVEEEVEADQLLPGDQRTAAVMVEIGNTISPYTRVEADFPSAHRSGQMPFLDLQLSVAADNTINWRFYKKPMASQYFILNRSAVPGRVKMASLAQEGIRRLRNTRPSLHAGDRTPLLEDMAEMLYNSGYPEEYRANILRSAVTGYSRQVEADRAGTKPLYRPREWQQEERERRRLIKRASWYRPADTVLFLPVTPGSVLASRVRGVVEEESRRLGMTVRVVERGGVSLKEHLVRTDMGEGGPCPQGDCVLCLTNPGERGGLRHHRSGALYSGSCLLCPAEHGDQFTAVYTGETGDSGYTRTFQHGQCITRRDQANAFAHHLAEYHPQRQGDIQAFKFRVERTFRKALMRQIWEAIEIHGSRATIILNSRSEWEQPAIDRIVVERELPERQQGRNRRGGGGD